jgi:hypothetical protein
MCSTSSLRITHNSSRLQCAMHGSLPTTNSLWHLGDGGRQIGEVILVHENAGDQDAQLLATKLGQVGEQDPTAVVRLEHLEARGHPLQAQDQVHFALQN